jgi:hypothetical protein
MRDLPTITIFGQDYRVPLMTLGAAAECDRQREILVNSSSSPGDKARAMLRMLAAQLAVSGLPFHLSEEEIEAIDRRMTPGDMLALDRYMTWWFRESYGPGEAIATSLSTVTGNGSSPNLPTTDTSAATTTLLNAA